MYSLNTQKSRASALFIEGAERFAELRFDLGLGHALFFLWPAGELLDLGSVDWSFLEPRKIRLNLFRCRKEWMVCFHV